MACPVNHWYFSLKTTLPKDGAQHQEKNFHKLKTIPPCTVLDSDQNISVFNLKDFFQTSQHFFWRKRDLFLCLNLFSENRTASEETTTPSLLLYIFSMSKLIHLVALSRFLTEIVSVALFTDSAHDK